MIEYLVRRLSPVRVIALGFGAIILIGSVILILPISLKDGVSVSYIDSLYTSASAVCVTGLLTVEAGDTFSVFGQIVLAVLIQIGGLGVSSMGAGLILMAGKRLGLKGQNLIKEASNLDSGKGISTFVKSVFKLTVGIELAGAVLCFFVFVGEYPLPRAIGLSIFHSIASFNNAGIDVFGGGTNLIRYQDNVAINMITVVLIILGGIGFLLIREVWDKKFIWKKFSMHTKTVLSVTAILIAVSTVLFRLTENIPWMGAFFAGVTTRTAGFSTYSFGSFSNAGLILSIVLMVIGASPGSTGGGVKTTTLFVLLQGIKSSATNQSEKAFKYAIPGDAFRKAAIIVLMAISIILASTFLLAAMEPEIPAIDALFEMASAFGTVGLSTGITPSLCLGSKLLSIVIMYIGRLGPLTVASLWYFTKGERVRYPEGNISIG